MNFNVLRSTLERKLLSGKRSAQMMTILGIWKLKPNLPLKFIDEGHIQFGYRIKEDLIEFYIADTVILIPHTLNIFSYLA